MTKPRGLLHIPLVCATILAAIAASAVLELKDGTTEIGWLVFICVLFQLIIIPIIIVKAPSKERKDESP